MDWQTEIAVGALVQARIEELDHGRLWERHLPTIAASDLEIAAVERQITWPLDARYKEFLRYANGWRHLYQTVDLFGTAELGGGPLMDSARRQLEAVGGDLFQLATGVSIGSVMPIAASAEQRDLFLIETANSSNPGSVIWFSGQQIERYENFDEYFLAMIDYNRLEIATLEREATARST